MQSQSQVEPSRSPSAGRAPVRTGGRRTGDIFIVCAADEHYAIPLTVTLHSVARHLDRDRQLEIFVLDGGMSEQSRSILKETLSPYSAELHRIVPDPSRLTNLRVSHHVTHTAYFRLLAGRLLPSDIDKIIYLDSDLIIRQDLTELWVAPLEDHYCLAVPDIACPYVDARVANRNFRRSSPYMASIRPIPNYEALGLDGAAEYFNSGVMVLNLRRWRAENVADKLLDCLHANERFVWCWDQYALNVVFAKQWGRLPPRFNQGAHAFEYPSVDHSPIDREEFQAMRSQPAIIHYTTEFKPWSDRCAHPLGPHFFEQVDQTAYRGWRPTKPKFSFHRWCQLRGVDAQKQLMIAYRKLHAAWERAE